MKPNDASFEEGWGAPEGEAKPAVHGDAVERGDVVPAAQFRAIPARRSAESRVPYLPWYEWRRMGARGPRPHDPGGDAPASLPTEPEQV